jgi:hypothetical protein
VNGWPRSICVVHECFPRQQASGFMAVTLRPLIEAH